jgi:uncharacterized membrane protein YheB (UPF0754 family)
LTQEVFGEMQQQTIQTKTWIVDCIRESRKKDYENEFRKMVYNNDQEMEEVIGKLDQNTFILEQEKQLKELKEKMRKADVINEKSL